MWHNIGYEQCLSYLQCQLSPGERRVDFDTAIRPAITISRMTGSGGRTIASLLADQLQERAPTDCRWTVFDRNLIEEVLEDHHLPKRMAQFLPENHKSFITDAIEELLGLHPSAWVLVRQTAETILHLASMGYVILVGRGANIVTAKLENAFHVRLVGSIEARTARVQEVYQLDHRSALEFIEQEDRGRRRYLKEHYGKEIDDPLLYHLIINTERIGFTEAARLIAYEVVERFRLDQKLKAETF